MELQSLDSLIQIFKQIGVNWKLFKELIRADMELYIKQNGDKFMLSLKSLRLRMEM